MATEGGWDVYTVGAPDPIEERLTAAADHVDVAREAYELALEHRNLIVVEAIEVEGCSVRQVARSARLARSRITRILAEV